MNPFPQWGKGNRFLTQMAQSYKNERGVVVNTSPWRLADYWKWMRQPEMADYDLR